MERPNQLLEASKRGENWFFKGGCPDRKKLKEVPKKHLQGAFTSRKRNALPPERNVGLG